MEDINVSTRDEYGLKQVYGILCALEKFETYFLRFGFLLFCCAENISKVFQAKDISIQEAAAVSAVLTTQAFYISDRMMRSIIFL